MRAGESENVEGHVQIKPSCLTRIVAQKLFNEPTGQLPSQYSHLHEKVVEFFTYKSDQIVFRGVADDRIVSK